MKLGDIKTTSPHIENQVAKDRIRVAPQNRRKPSRYLSGGSVGNAPPKPARSASSFSFKEDSSFLSKIDENSDNFTSSNVSRHNSNVSRHASNASRGSGRESLPPSSRSNSESARQASFDNESPSSYHGSSEHVPRALANKHSFSAADDFESRKERSLAQRSYSTNSRENVNRPKLPPVKPPRSTNTSTQSLVNEDVPVKKLSLGELKNKLFYTESFDKNDEKKQLSREEVFGSRNSIEKVDESNKNTNRYSYGDNRSSYGDKRSSFGEEKRLSKGSSRTSLPADKRNSIDEETNSYGASFRLSNGKISSISNDSTGFHRRSREDVSSDQSFNKGEDKKELVFRKSNDSSAGMLAMALTSPRQDRKIEAQQEQQTSMARSKSLSEKLENQHRTDINFAHGSKSVGHVNKTGAKPSVSPRKPTTYEKEEAPLEFRRVSLRTVPKKEDYTGSENTDVQTINAISSNKDESADTSDIFDFIYNEMNLVDDYHKPTTNTESPANTVHTGARANKISHDHQQVVTESEEVVTNSMAFTRSSVNNIDLNTNLKSATRDRVSGVVDDVKPKVDLRTGSWKAPSNIETRVDTEVSYKRHSLKSSDRGTSLDQQHHKQSSNDSLNSLEMKRHSLKKIDRFSSSSSIEQSYESNDLDFKRNSLKKLDSPLQQGKTSKESDASDERAPRQLTKNRSTMHGGSPNKNFSFQSSDVIMARSKSLSSTDQRRLNDEKEPADGEAASTESEGKSEPEWFKMARQKQKTEEANQGTPTKDVSTILCLIIDDIPVRHYGLPLNNTTQELRSIERFFKSSIFRKTV